MTTKIENPPAFARPFADNGRGEYSADQQGMTLRDYFAGQALAGLCAAPSRSHADELAINAYWIADQMLKIRKA